MKTKEKKKKKHFNRIEDNVIYYLLHSLKFFFPRYNKVPFYQQVENILLLFSIKKNPIFKYFK